MKVDIKIEEGREPIVILEAETETEQESLDLLGGFDKLRFRIAVNDEEVS